MIKVLTIDREYGAGGSEIAARVAERLGWKLWDQSLTDEIARRLECSGRLVEEHEERKDPLYYRLFKSFLRGSAEGSQNAHKLKIADADSIRIVSERLVRNAANEGNCVIVGRGGAYYLKNRTDTFHVFVYAPFEEKVRRVQQRGKTEEEAIQLVSNVDADRTAFIKQYFGLEWPARPLFDLMINSTMGDEAVAKLVLQSLA